MFQNKKAKSKKMRGTSSHGFGHKKKHRGSGSRGGFGNAGTGARGDSKKPTILTTVGATYFGKKGFTSKKGKNKTLSLSYVEGHFDALIERGVITKQGSDYVLDAKKQKFDKILGRGKFTKKLKVVCEQISEQAKLRIEEAGGSVQILASKKPAVSKEKKEEPKKE